MYQKASNKIGILQSIIFEKAQIANFGQRRDVFIIKKILMKNEILILWSSIIFPATARLHRVV